MLKIHHRSNSRSERIVWLAEEMGLPYETVPAPYGDASLKSLNPLGSIPVLQDGDVVITESLAIMDYMMDRYGPTPLKPAPNDPAYPAYIQFFHLSECALGARFRNLTRGKFVAPEGQKENWATEDSRSGVENALGMISARLDKGPYLSGEDFNAADISCGMLLFSGEKYLDLKFAPSIKTYIQRLEKRPAYQRTLAVK